MSTATVTVNVGTEVFSVSRLAMVWRMRLSVSPSPATLVGAGGAATGAAGAGEAAAGAAAGVAPSAAARTSRSTMRPPGPDPVTERGSIPSGGRQGHSVPFVPLVAVDPIGDGNDAEASN